MLFNFNNWNNSGKKEYDSKKKKKRKNYIHNFQQIFRPETIVPLLYSPLRMQPMH